MILVDALDQLPHDARLYPPDGTPMHVIDYTKTIREEDQFKPNVVLAKVGHGFIHVYIVDTHGFIDTSHPLLVIHAPGWEGP